MERKKVNLKIDPQVYESFKEQSKAEHLSVSRAVELVMMECVERGYIVRRTRKTKEV